LAAIKALSQIGHQSTTPVLVTLSQNPSPEVAQAATASLAAFPEHAGPAVLKMFQSSQTSQRLTALELIGLRRMTASLPALMMAAIDTNSDIRVKALKTIGELGSLAELPGLLALLTQITDAKHLDAMRQALTELCARAKSPGACVTQLTSTFSQSNVAQKVALIRVLSSIQGAAALKVVRDAVDDPNPEIHLGAIRALGTWNNADAAPELLTLVRTSKNTRDRTLCLRGYLRIAERRNLPTNQRLAMCQEIEPLLKQTAEKQQWLGVLGRIDSPKALAQIMPYFNDASVKETVCTVSITLIERVGKKNPRILQNRTVKKALQKIVDVSTQTNYQQRAKRLLGST
jgi:HEAT repeat protein